MKTVTELIQENLQLRKSNEELASQLVQYEWHTLYWTINDIAFNMIEQLKSYSETSYFDDFLYDVYQREDYLESEQEAMYALSQYSKRGIYDVIRDINKYAEDNNYYVSLKFDNPVQTASCVYALLAEKLLKQALHDCDLQMNDKLSHNQQVIDKLTDYIDNADSLEQYTLF